MQGRIYVAGENGLVGSNLLRRLMTVSSDVISTGSKALDLRDRLATERYFQEHRPDYVILVAARHGGIGMYQTCPAECLEDNTRISSNVIQCCYRYGVKRLINIGASCVYPEGREWEYKEENYDKQMVQKSTEPYGLAKLYGMKLCEYYNREKGTDFISLLPTNLYGDGIGYRLDESSVLPAMMKRFHMAKQQGLNRVEVWGNGRAHREFLHVSDLVNAILLLLSADTKGYTMFNVGSGEILSINALAEMIADVVGYEGEIWNNLSKPNGADRGQLDCGRLHELGWHSQISLREGLEQLYDNWKRGLCQTK